MPPPSQRPTAPPHRLLEGSCTLRQIIASNQITNGNSEPKQAAGQKSAKFCTFKLHTTTETNRRRKPDWSIKPTRVIELEYSLTSHGAENKQSSQMRQSCWPKIGRKAKHFSECVTVTRMIASSAFGHLEDGEDLGDMEEDRWTCHILQTLKRWQRMTHRCRMTRAWLRRGSNCSVPNLASTLTSISHSLALSPFVEGTPDHSSIT